MSKVSGTNFLHRLSLAQKQVFPENSVFSISAVTTSKLTAPTSLTSHRPLSPSRSVPVSKPHPQPPSPYGKHKTGANQSTGPVHRKPSNDEIFDDAPPVPQKYSDAIAVVTREKPQGPASLAMQEMKARRRHSSINYSSEFEKEQEKEREKLEHVNVGGAMYAVVRKPSTKSSAPNLPADGAAEKEVRRIRPKTPSPSAQRRGYVQLEFQNGLSSLSSQNQVPVPKRGIVPDSRTKWNYSTVVFDTQGQKEKESEFENDSGTKKRGKPLPPTPAGFKSSMSDPNILTPLPAHRHKKPQSLGGITEPNGRQRKELEYAAIEFSPVQNGSAGKGRRELPKLPPKQASLESPSQPRPV